MALLLVASLITGSCDSDSEPVADDPIDGVASFATWNAGLADGFVVYTPQRRPLIGDFVATIDADVVCLQEVWTQEEVDGVLAKTSAAYPHNLYELLEDTTVGEPACTEEETAPLLACVRDKCPDVLPSELADCVINNCSTEFLMGTSTGCQGCLASNLGKPIDEIADACLNGAALFFAEGANGLLLLSKHPMIEPLHKKLDSSFTQRSVLAAKVDLPKLGVVDVLCTHLAADLAHLITYQGTHGSFIEEQIVQAEEVIALAGERGASVQVVLGDLNSGPGFGDAFRPDVPEGSYKRFTDAGWVGWPEASGAPLCSYCADNPISGADHGDSVLIDHVMFKGLPPSLSTGSFVRFGTELVSYTDGDGNPVETPLSDHYGFVVSLDYRPVTP